jgi:hypothetical protein
MSYALPIIVTVLLSAGADGALYAFANRERPPITPGCWLSTSSRCEQREAQLRLERDLTRVSALVVNVAAISCIGATLLRLRRDRDLIE